jgi:hypothetical protein
MIEPPQISGPDRQPATNKLQLAIFDKVVVSAEGRLAIVVAAAIVISVAFIWTQLIACWDR